MPHLRSFFYIFITLLILAAVAAVSLLASFSLGFGIYKISTPRLYKDGEEALSILGFGILITPILLLLSTIPSYFICMRLAIYLREKRGWEIRHPRKMFLISLLLVLTTGGVLLMF